MNEWTYVANTVNVILGVDIFNRRRHRELVEARFIYCHIMRHEFNKTVSAIGRRLNKNHATVLHSLKGFEDLMSLKDKEFREKYNRIINIIQTEYEVDTSLTEEDIIKIQEDQCRLLSSNKLLADEVKSNQDRISKLEEEVLSLKIELKSKQVDELKKMSFYRNLFERIIHTAPHGKEQELVVRLNRYLNGIRLQ
jgi:chromosomal replication initiation ATPase DnaA